MAIIQISRIIQRSGNLVDLPQLAEAELGWANDARRLFVGRAGSYDAENVEVLTSYSSISFGQLEGSYGNLDFTAPVEGQIITYDVSANAWVNTGGNADQPGNTAQYSNNKVHLGDINNVKIGGGSLGYVLETDGQGNLAWSTKGILRNPIIDIGNSTPIIIQVANDTPYVNGLEITITGANAVNANSILNGQTFYVRLSNDFPITGNVALFSDAALNVAIDGSNLSSYQSNSGIATALLSSASGGSGEPDGITGAIQFKGASGFFQGSSQLAWEANSSTILVQGNANITGAINSGSLSATGVITGSQIISTVSTGNPPLVVSSTTQVANLNAATAGTVRTAAQPNITSVGTLTSLTVSGNANIGNIGATNGVFTNVSGNGSSLTSITGANVTGTVANATFATSAGSATTITTNAQPNITSVGTLSNLSVTGNVTANYFIGNIIGNISGNISAPGANTQIIFNDAGTANASSNFTFNKTSGNSNVGNIGATNGVFTNVSGNGALLTGINASNLSTGTLPSARMSGTYTINISGSATTAGTATTAAQPNITSVGILTSLNVSGTANLGNTLTRVITTGSNITTGNITGNWTLTAGSTLQATYADLAEYYESDEKYTPGTVLKFGGDKEVTLANNDTNKVAGVVTTNPAYVMNATCAGEYTVAIALQGRVPVKVMGKIAKGDMLCSAGDGYAKSSIDPKMGTIIGKALENFDGDVGVIEMAIGRI